MNHSYISQGGDRFDVLKFVLALLIVAMHSGIFPRWLLPVSRLAVPLFFIMTSYFFHLRLIDVVDKKERTKVLLKYVRRNVQLYLFWSIVLFPSVILFHLSWFKFGFVYAVFKVLRNFLITGFFPASWFILATVYAVLIVFVLSKWMKNGWIFFIALALYSFALLDSNYGGILSQSVRDSLNIFNIRQSLNLPAALIWVIIGKILAERPINISQSITWLLLSVASVAYYGEFFMVEYFGWSIHTDCFVMSIPLCTLIFIVIGQSVDIKCKHALKLRKSSIIIYCLHKTIISVLEIVSSHSFEMTRLVIFVITLICSVCLAFVIIYLREQKDVKCLKYSY
jgi:hypothetical protein